MTIDATNLNIVWMMVCAALVMLMQAGFCCLESGMARAKNSINVALKNIVDFCVAAVIFWAFGFGLMFGPAAGDSWGSEMFLLPGHDHWLLAFFLFQMVFCGTATTILSGAVAERMRFSGYLLVAVVVSGFFYPMFGQWAWGGVIPGTSTGFLAERGFIDFAGSSVVHSVGGWLALAAVIVVGPRIGRFGGNGPAPHGHNLPMATLGVLILWFGWFGFNGGSTLAINGDIPLILVNTNLAAAAGGIAALFLGWVIERRSDVGHTINGVVAGLVGITAGCHLMEPSMAILVGVVAGIICVSGTYLLWKLQVDDVIGAVPAHALAGAWGTLAVALVGNIEAFGEGATRWHQLRVQAEGVSICFLFAFCGGITVFWLINRVFPLRVSKRREIEGLNISEHGATTELIELLSGMRHQCQRADFSTPVAVEPHTEVGQIAAEYNRVIERVNKEMLARETAVQALQQAEEKYRGIFENVVEGIFQTTADGKFLSANPALARIFGYDSPQQMMEEVHDIGMQLYAHPDRRRRLLDLMQKNGRVTDFACQMRTRAGKPLEVNINARGIFAGDRLDLLEGTVIDLTQRRQAEQFRQEKEAAEAANRAKSNFLARISHEIRTPLNGVIGTLELTASTELTQQQQRYIRIAKSSANALLSLINDILDFSKIEAGKLELEQVEFNLHELIDEVIEMFGHRAEAKSLELACCVLPDVPNLVIGDPERLRQIFINLVNNALKFTEQGNVSLRAAVVATRSNDVVVRFEVEDTGIGISPDHRHKLFAPFSQVDASTTRKYGGTGLGLAICRQLVELMRGQIGVDSTEGRGSTFWMTIPLTPVTSQGNPKREVPERLKSVRVLAVDDNEVNLEILQEQLSSWGFQIATTSQSTHALHLLRAAASSGKPYQLAILDQVMPDTDGMELAREIRLDQNLTDTRLLMLTSVDGDLNSDQLSTLGLAGWITKPIRQSRLFDTIISTLGSSAVSTPAPVSQNKVDVSIAGRRILVAEDNEINQLVTSEILQAAGCQCHLVDNGRKAVDAIRVEQFDLILMDCQMPELDGFEATREIRWLEQQGEIDTGGIPIVALTANAIKGDRQRCLDAGMNGYVTKPIEPEQLLSTIAECLNGTEPVQPTEVQPVRQETKSMAPPVKIEEAVKTVEESTLEEVSLAAPVGAVLPPEANPASNGHAVQRAPQKSQPETSSVPEVVEPATPVTIDQGIDQGIGQGIDQGIDEESLLERCMGNRDCMLRVLKKFAQRSQDEVAQIAASIQEGKWTEAARQTHSLKGAAANVSAVTVKRAAAELEELLLRESAEATQAVAHLQTVMQHCLVSARQILNESED